jgi:hypothetical protein
MPFEPDIDHLPSRVVESATGVSGTFVECPIVPQRQWHPSSFVLFVPDNQKERVEAWLKTEAVKYFASESNEYPSISLAQ